ncbi:MAG: hypothetical protein ACFFBZ_08215 [Promethearchaeota archaeon]
MKNDPENNDPKDIQGLVVFKDVKSQQTQKNEVVSLEYIDQEDKIKLVCKLEPFGGNYIYSLLIINQSMAPITEVKIRIRYPDFFILCRSNPPKIIIDSDLIEENEKQIRIEFKKLDQNSQKQINTFFTPLSLEEKGEIRSYVTFINNADFVRALDSDPVIVKFDPISIERKILPSSEVRNFLQLPDIKRGIKSIGIGIENLNDFDYLFYLLNQTIEDHNFQLITKDDEKKISWYFGTELVSGADLLIIGQFKSNKIEVLVASKNPHILIPILTTFVTEFSNRLIIENIIDTLDQIYDLECKYCGTVLPYFPRKGESVECTKCKYEKIIWS